LRDLIRRASSSELLAGSALYRLRSAQGVVGLADKHDPGRPEAACAKATAAGDPVRELSLRSGSVKREARVG
jgi:hypothetical protein